MLCCTVNPGGEQSRWPILIDSLTRLFIFHHEDHACTHFLKHSAPAVEDCRPTMQLTASIRAKGIHCKVHCKRSWGGGISTRKVEKAGQCANFDKHQTVSLQKKQNKNKKKTDGNDGMGL